MHTSRPIAVGGRFLGIAIAQGSQAWHFKVTDPVIEELDGAAFVSPAEAERVAGLVLARNTAPVRPVLRAGAWPVSAQNDA